MRDEKICVVGGFPISHSLSPHLFALVHQHLGISWNMPVKINTNSLFDLIECEKKIEPPSENFKKNVIATTHAISGSNFKLDSELSLDIISENKSYYGLKEWGSITSPLKHQILDSNVNCYALDEDGLRFTMTDGYGVVLVAKHFGIDFSLKPILSIKGGGSSAISTANAWLQSGGRVTQIKGRRLLPKYIIEKCEPDAKGDFHVDFDESSDYNGLVLFPKYGDEIVDLEGKIDGRWMLVAQHILAWRFLFFPESKDNLPSLELLYKRLIYLESLLKR